MFYLKHYIRKINFVISKIIRMNAIRKIMKRDGNRLDVELPEDFKAESVELIILPIDEQQVIENAQTDEQFRIEMMEFYSKYNADLSNYKFNRDDVYDRT